LAVKFLRLCFWSTNVWNLCSCVTLCAFVRNAFIPSFSRKVI